MPNTQPPDRRVPVAGFLWDQFAPYHADRCVAVAARGECRVVGIELCDSSALYAWAPVAGSAAYEKLTLFPGRRVEQVGQWRRFVAMARVIVRHRITHLFLAGYQMPGCFALALFCRIGGRHVYVMLDSKFDDKPRRIVTESFKRLMMLPYHGALGAGARTRRYLRFLGFADARIADGYDSVSIARVAAAAPATDAPWEDRPFLVIARFVPKKNLQCALRAYALYRERAGGRPRALHLCGDGPLDADLRALAAELGISGDVLFLGFQQAPVVARALAAALCLLLPSTEEQWGLVVNEALAFGLPVIASPNAGATDALVVNWRNGFIVEPDNIAGWAEAMLLLSRDRARWDAFSAASHALAPRGDVAAFAAGSAYLIAHREAET